MFRTQPTALSPAYANYAARLHSFAGRPLPSGQTADALANAGFFYVGKHTVMTVYMH